MEIEEMERERSAFTKSVEIVEKAIISRGKELKEFVDKCTWSLLEDLTAIKYDALKDMESETEEFGSHVLLRNRSKTDRTDFESTFPFDGLQESFAQKQQPPVAPTQERIPSIQISFEASKLEDLLEGSNIIGKIKKIKQVAVETAETGLDFHKDEKTVDETLLNTGEHEKSGEKKTDGTLLNTEEHEQLDEETADETLVSAEEHEKSDEEKADETLLKAEEHEESVGDKEVILEPMNIANEFHEKKAMARKKGKKTKISDRHNIGQQDVQRLPLLCATYAYSVQQSPASQVRKSHRISLIKTLDLPRVYGVTKLEDSIYVLSWMPNSIRVYSDRDPFPLHDEIPIEEIRNPEDVACNANRRCLYVSDVHDKCIWEITLVDHQVTKWLSNIDRPFTLSVSSDGQLLSLSEHTLEIYGSEARLIRRLRLPSTIHRPLHAIQKPNGQFIIVHILKTRETRQWAISHLTGDGQLIGQLIPKAESVTLDWPYHMALDSEDDRLFVADYWNHRVIMCDSFSQSETILKNTIHRPLRVHYDPNKRQLIVANARRLDIYMEH